MFARDKEDIWKKYQMYEVLEDSEGNSLDGVGKEVSWAVKALDGADIIERGPAGFYFRLGMYDMLLCYDSSDRGHARLYVSSNTPQESIDDVISEFRNPRYAEFQTLWEEGKKARRQVEERFKSVREISRRDMNRILRGTSYSLGNKVSRFFKGIKKYFSNLRSA